MADRPFLLWLRQALQHLYDAPELRKSPLFALLRLDAREGTQGLRSVLEVSIEALKPPPGTGTQSDAWRNYHCLFRRYVQQFSQEEVAASLGMSVRHLQRQANIALESMADDICTRYGVKTEHLSQLEEQALAHSSGVPLDLAGSEDPIAGETSGSGEGGRPPGREEELAWLERSSVSEPAVVAEVIAGVQETLAPLQATAGAQVTYRLLDEAAALIVERSALRQALLNLVPVALRTAGGAPISVEVTSGQQYVCVSVRWSPSAGTADVDGLDIVSQLLSVAGGTLEIVPVPTGAVREIRVLLPALAQAPVLVIDDNPDALQLLSRYLEGTSYCFVGTRDPEQALGLAQERQPRAIILDVMLPGTDGWELLGRLREHPATRGIPVIVCSVLPRQDLALSLGAAGFLSKPVRRQALLTVLAQLAPVER